MLRARCTGCEGAVLRGEAAETGAAAIKDICGDSCH